MKTVEMSIILPTRQPVPVKHKKKKAVFFVLFHHIHVMQTQMVLIKLYIRCSLIVETINLYTNGSLPSIKGNCFYSVWNEKVILADKVSTK